MAVAIAGIAELSATLAVLACGLPRGGTTQRYVDTALEPYTAVAVCGGFALGLMMMARCDSRM
jgi:hypothetical protein